MGVVKAEAIKIEEDVFTSLGHLITSLSKLLNEICSPFVLFGMGISSYVHVQIN